MLSDDNMLATDYMLSNNISWKHDIIRSLDNLLSDNMTLFLSWKLHNAVNICCITIWRTWLQIRLLSVFRSACVLVCLSACLSVFLTVRLSACLFFRLPACLHVCLSTWQSVHMWVQYISCLSSGFFIFQSACVTHRAFFVNIIKKSGLAQKLHYTRNALLISINYYWTISKF
jgi:hypothetical protein